LNSADTHFHFVGCNGLEPFFSREMEAMRKLRVCYLLFSKNLTKRSAGSHVVILQQHWQASNTSTNLVCTIEQPHPQQATSQQWNMCLPTAVYNPTSPPTATRKKRTVVI
jgi:hypothetical protein